MLEYSETLHVYSDQPKITGRVSVWLMSLFCFDNYIKAQAQTGCQSSQGAKLQAYHNVLGLKSHVILLMYYSDKQGIATIKPEQLIGNAVTDFLKQYPSSVFEKHINA